MNTAFGEKLFTKANYVLDNKIPEVKGSCITEIQILNPN